MIFIPNPGLEAAIQHEAADNVRSIAEEVLSHAQSLCPVDTGELLDSLHVEDGENGSSLVVAGTDHWLFPEFGTAYEAAQPYLRPALDEVKV